MSNKQKSWAYVGATALIAISLFFPWLVAKSSSSIRYGDLGRDMSGMGLGAQGLQMQQLGNQSASFAASLSGVSTLWGKGILLLAIAGLGLAFIGPSKAIPSGKPNAAMNQKLLMAGIGVVALSFVAIAYLTASGQFGQFDQGSEVSSQYVNSSSSISFAGGWVVAAMAAIAMSITGFLTDWTEGSVMG